MSKVSFFTPISYQTISNSEKSPLLEKVDDYFYLCGKKAHVIGLTKNKQEKVVLSESKSSRLANVAKVISYFTVLIPLIMLMAKVVLRSKHNFKLIDPKQKLEKGMNISESTALKIKELMPKIIKWEEDKDIEWLSKANNLVFKIKGAPDIVYKMVASGKSGGGMSSDAKAKTEQRFENMVKAKKVCLIDDLALLTIPHAKKFDIGTKEGTYTLIAEENLDFDPQESAQEECYHKYAKDLNETARQLATFVAKTGFNDVIWRNIPLLNETSDFKGPRRVALIDLEYLENTKQGILGIDGWKNNGSCGLVRCVSEEQIDIVLAEARKQGVDISEDEAKQVKNKRLKELEDYKQLQAFYAKKGIKSGKEPIQVNLDSLGLNLAEEGQISVMKPNKDNRIIWEKETITLKKVTEDVIHEINKEIQNSSDKKSIKGKRYLEISTSKEPFFSYASLGLAKAMFSISEEEAKKLWLRRIVEALVEKGYLFKCDITNSCDLYRIQA